MGRGNATPTRLPARHALPLAGLLPYLRDVHPLDVAIHAAGQINKLVMHKPADAPAARGAIIPIGAEIQT